jgi:acetylornithine deacetylase/succinyl-diaminopimelate desuccinylase-like protein
METLDSSIIDFVRETAGSAALRDYLRGTLIELVRLNTAAESDLSATAQRERKFFDRLERMIQEAGGEQTRIERQAIPPAIARDPDYSIPGYALRSANPAPAAQEIYANRGNLLAWAGDRAADDNPGVILHAHVDVVPPWFDASQQGDRIYGRGACDNKAQVAILLAQMRLLRELHGKFPAARLQSRLYQFVIDEEIGGNGSVAAASDPRLAGAPVLMHESTNLVPYCAHRGCVYYRCELSIGDNENMTAVELYPFVVLALESEGRRIQRETDHPGFTADHVQTNHGILGPYGHHAGNVCDHVAVDVSTFTNAHPDRLAMKLTQYFDEALLEYFKRYGDKSREQDASGRPKLSRHFDVKVLPGEEGQHARVDIYGRSGHMAAIRDCDNAITKAALLFGALLKNASRFENLRAYGRLSDMPESDTGRSIVLEGGQGFTPAHTMEQIQSRMTEAATDAVRQYCRLRRRRFDESMVKMSFDRLHSDAYADSPESPPMQALLAACAAVSHPVPPITAWQTSCDARIYHHKGHPVAIFGAGKLDLAHSAHEHVDLDDLQKALAISTLATLSLAIK